MSDAVYRSTDWRVLRTIIKRRDPVCVCGRATAHVDHIVSRRQGGSDDPSNLRGRCHPCHNSDRRNAPLRAIGCSADPARPWLSWGEPVDDGRASWTA